MKICIKLDSDERRAMYDTLNTLHELEERVFNELEDATRDTGISKDDAVNFLEAILNNF